MKRLGILRNTIQEYAWGSLTAIPEFLGEKTPSPEPQAEIWMGAHPKAPSTVKFAGEWRSLLALIEEDPENMLGKEISERFQRKLPYLFKVLAAEKPLSIQAHPNRMQARTGFKKENQLGIPLDSPKRNYRDDNHKPEMICALTDFWAMCGFRKIPNIISLLGKACPTRLEEETEIIKRQPNPHGLKQFFHVLLTLNQDRKREVINRAVENSKRYSEEDLAFEWVTKIAKEYPSDIGILSPLLLNLLCLKPGQALFLPSGVLHAYLHGVGMELMANSDNVLRGGLTPKHIDAPELLRILRFSAHEVNLIQVEERSDGEWVYMSPAEEFTLSAIFLKENALYVSPTKRSVEMILCTEGEATVRDTVHKDAIALAKGTSILIPAALKGYEIQGRATLYKAGVPVSVHEK